MPNRHFLPEDFTLDNWESIKPYFENLNQREIFSVSELRQWFTDRSILEAFLSENFAWCYIRMTCDTANELLEKEFDFFVTKIQPQLTLQNNLLNRKALSSPFLNQIEDSGYKLLTRSLRKDIEIFREKNVNLQTRLQTEEQKFSLISGAMTVKMKKKELTLAQAGDFLQNPDRTKREEAYHKIQGCRLQNAETLDNLFDTLICLRHQIAENADFVNFRDYMFTAMGRFDYTPQDCFNFHESIQNSVVPLLNELAGERKKALKVSQLRPWDTKVDISGEPPLKPFKNTQDFIEKTIICFGKIDPFLGECLVILQKKGYLDLESRKGKAPGGYNYPLDKSGLPFIFMNATSTVRDLVTLLHEGGHAIHTFLTRDLALNAFKQPPSEVAELASMSMELISMKYWEVFFENENDLRRAKKQHLEQIIETLPWVATIDKFQHWLYENPSHTTSQRTEIWNRTFSDFSDTVTDWSGLEKYKNILWQKQLHLFEVPFYYIEYGIAQLGAIAIWKNYQEDPEKGLQDYLDALRLGYTRPIREIYETAGISFDFSEKYIAELMNFVRKEIEKLSK